MTTAQDYAPLLPLLVAHPPTKADPVYGFPALMPTLERGVHKVDQFERGMRCSCGWERAADADWSIRLELLENHQRGI